MENKHIDSKKLIVSLLIGGALGAGALYCVHAAQNRKTPVLKKIGKTISDVGEMLENCDLSSYSDALEGIEKKIPKASDVISSVTDWVGTGLNLWKQFTKG